MDWVPRFFKSFLPTPWSRKVVTASWSIALILLFLPEWGAKVGLPALGQETLWPRLFGVATVLFLGSFVSLCLVARAYHARETQHAFELKEQCACFDAAAEENKRRNDDFTKPLKIDTEYVV